MRPCRDQFNVGSLACVQGSIRTYRDKILLGFGDVTYQIITQWKMMSTIRCMEQI